MKTEDYLTNIKQRIAFEKTEKNQYEKVERISSIGLREKSKQLIKDLEERGIFND